MTIGCFQLFERKHLLNKILSSQTSSKKNPPWTDPDRHKDRIFIEKRRAVQVHLGEVVLLCLTKFFTINIHKSLNTNERYDTFGNLVRLPRNQGKSRQKSLEIRKSGLTSEITNCHEILFKILVKS